MTRSKRTAAMVAAVLLVSSGAAGATATIVPAGVPRSSALDAYQQIIDGAYVPTPPMQVPVALSNFDAGHQSGIAFGGHNRPYIKFPDMTYLLASGTDPSEWQYQRVLLLHEMGHVWDIYERRTAMTMRPGPARTVARSFRQRFVKTFDPAGYRLPGYVPGFWYSYYGGAILGYDEMFADEYALCAAYGDVVPADNPYQGYGRFATPERHRQVCELIRSTSRVLGWG